MANTFNSTYYTLTTSVSDVYTATDKTLTLLIQATNIDSEARTCSLFMTDASNNYVSCLFPTADIASLSGLSDDGKHVIPSGYKIRGSAEVNSVVYIEVNTLEDIS